MYSLEEHPGSHIRIIQDGLCQLEVEKKKLVKNYLIDLLALESDYFQKNSIGSQRKMPRATLIRENNSLNETVYIDP